MTRLLFLTILLILVICASGLCAPPYTDLPDNPRIEKLINQLGSKKYKDREEAQNQLRTSGSDSLPQSGSRFRRS